MKCHICGDEWPDVEGGLESAVDHLRVMHTDIYEPPERWPDGQLVVTDAVILARVTRMSDGRSSFVLCGSEGMDTVTRTGLIECARQVNDGGWHDVDEEDE